MANKILALGGVILALNIHGNSQNVGIGTATPLQTLHVLSASDAHTARFEGPDRMYLSLFENGIYRGYWGSFAGNEEDVDFGTGAGNANGKLHLTIQANPCLTVDQAGNVGIGTTSPNWKLDVNGSMQLLGRLFVSGSSGTSGQVLTSNGLSAPSWQTLGTPFPQDRAMVFLSNAGNTLPDALLKDFVLGTVAYNLNPVNQSVLTTGITVNTTGLYEIEYSCLFQGTLVTSGSVLPHVFASVIATGTPTRSYTIITDVLNPTSGSSFSRNFKDRMLLHINAGTTIKLNGTVYQYTSGTPSVSGWISIHRIN
jgi:hypothetical protein